MTSEVEHLSHEDWGNMDPPATTSSAMVCTSLSQSFTLNPYDLILPDYVTYNRSITKAFFCYRISKHEWVKLSFPLLVMRTCYIAQRLVYTTGPSAVLPLIWYTQLFLYRVSWMTK